jgi:FtsZ-binding cell division protein ZapB
MYTIASLKAEHKTLAAAKAAHGIKASSWAVLADKLNNPQPEKPAKPVKPTIKGLQAQIAELKAENAALKQQSSKDTTEIESEYQSDYFKSAEAELIYSIVKLDGEDRMRALQITRSHYNNAKTAKDWRNKIANRVHPDKCRHPEAQVAATKIVEMYKSMVA